MKNQQKISDKKQYFKAIKPILETTPDIILQFHRIIKNYLKMNKLLLKVTK